MKRRRIRALKDIDESNILDTRLRREVCSIAMAMMAINKELTTYEEAIDSAENDEWRRAMQEEYSLLKNNMWTLVERPSNQKVINNKWVFKVKRNPDDSIERYKTRLVCCGFTQEYSIDYLETFSPVVRFSSLRAILAIAAEKSIHMLQFDVRTAFLYGKLNEDVYM